tara:strand:+ start:188 stop:385 length:198 start_codon:yes stop_codon:yes gene_type:complete
MKDLEKLNKDAFLFLNSAMLIRKDVEKFNLELSCAAWIVLVDKADYYIDLFFKLTDYERGQINLL